MRLFQIESALLAAAICGNGVAARWMRRAGGSINETRTWSVGQQVQTTSGDVTGHSSSFVPGVSEYLGIPYAQPPLGSLRFAAPLPYSGNSSIVADKFIADCPAGMAVPSLPDQLPAGVTDPNQLTGNALMNYVAAKVTNTIGQSADEMGEDCLGLNIWTKPEVGEKAKAVMVWIYGGGFSTGTTTTKAYNGALMAEEQDVVVVSVNYRVNVFGFPGAPGLPAYNLGLRDQRLATEWIRDNIAKFGGDPERITMFGQSAGGASVDIYTYAWTEDPIVHAFIPESGSALMMDNSPATVANSWYSLSKSLNCGGQEAGSKTVDCMRGKNWTAIRNSPMAASFGPVADEKIIFANFTARAEQGLFVKKPMLVGNNDNEAGLVSFIAEQAGLKIPQSYIQTADLFFTCPAGEAAVWRTKAGVPTWRYRYFGNWPNSKMTNDSGAYHSAEVNMIFGTAELTTGVNDTPAEATLAKLMRTAWTSFGKDPVNGLTKLGWPRYSETGQTLIALGYNDSSAPTFQMPMEYDAPCAGKTKVDGAFLQKMGSMVAPEGI